MTLEIYLIKLLLDKNFISIDEYQKAMEKMLRGAKSNA